MIINNKTKGVIVLKAVGMVNLRLFPGYNTVEEKDLNKYFQSKAALAQQKMNLAVVKSDDISAEEKKLADKAKEKNARLNKAQRVVKAQNETLAKNDKTISDQAEILKKQAIDLEVAIDNQKEQVEIIKDLQNRMKEFEKKSKK